MTRFRRLKRSLWAWKIRTMSRRFPSRIRHHVRNMTAAIAAGPSRRRTALPLERIKHLHIILSLKCNQRCRMCYQADFHRDLDPEICRRKLLPVYPHLEEIILQGGEPTAIAGTRPFMDFVLGINSRVRFSLMTNGMLFDRGWAELFCRHGRLVNFSLNAAGPETYARVSRTKHWPRIVDNLETLVGLRGPDSTPEIAISFVILEENIGELGAFIELGRRIGVDRVRFFFDPHLLPEDGDAVRKALDGAAAVRLAAGSLRVEGLERFEAVYFRKPADAPTCSSPFDTLFVDAGGETGLCCQMTRLIGDLRFSAVEKIWNGAPAARIRRAFRKGDYRYCGYYCRPLP